MLTAILYGVQCWDIPNEGGKPNNKGGKLFLIDPSAKQDDEGVKGYVPMEMSCDYPVFEMVKAEQLPCHVDVSFQLKQRKDARGKNMPTMHATALKVGQLLGK